MKLTIYTDGGARGNPGPAGVGVVIIDASGHIKKKIHRYIGNGTNNQAEYEALLLGLDEAKKLGAKEVEVKMDSELVVKQMKQEYKVKDKNLATLFLKVWNISKFFLRISYSHIPRAMNKEADALVNKALDERDKPKPRRVPSASLKLKVLKRDKLTCSKCKRNQYTNPNLELEVDHVVPYSAGGLTKIENLQTLCRECNQVKSSTLF